MEATYSSYDFLHAVERIDEILDSSENNFPIVKEIPSRDKLTFTNGYYVSASALCVDMRGSSDLSEKYSQPVLAKIYRSYISEMVAVLKGNTQISEIYIEGDGVWGVFDTPHKSDIDAVFSTGAKVASLIEILNHRYRARGIQPIKVGIGMTYGQALYIKAGYKGSAINEVVWLGKLVSDAHTLCSYGNRTIYDKRTMVSKIFHQNLNDHNKGLFEYSYNRDCYHGNIINTKMDEWLTR